MKNWIGLGFLIGFLIFLITGFLWAFGQLSNQSNRIERDFKEACAKVNGTAVWNRKYWECLK